jgi:hypothetical protein
MMPQTSKLCAGEGGPVVLRERRTPAVDWISFNVYMLEVVYLLGLGV